MSELTYKQQINIQTNPSVMPSRVGAMSPSRLADRMGRLFQSLESIIAGEYQNNSYRFAQPVVTSSGLILPVYLVHPLRSGMYPKYVYPLATNIWEVPQGDYGEIDSLVRAFSSDNTLNYAGYNLMPVESQPTVLTVDQKLSATLFRVLLSTNKHVEKRDE